MLNKFARAAFAKIMTPIARLLLRLRISPDAVTITGTLGVVVAALFFYPRGQLQLGTAIIIFFIFSDTLDGLMARLSGTNSSWGAYLDSTLDRFGDAAIFGGLLLYYTGLGNDRLMSILLLSCLILSGLVSYARARAEGLGMRADVGIAERADRLLLVLVPVLFTDLLWSDLVLKVMLVVLTAASLITVLQRMTTVRQQAQQMTAQQTDNREQ